MTVLNDYEKANAFSRYFSSIGVNEKNNCTTQPVV